MVTSLLGTYVILFATAGARAHMVMGRSGGEPSWFEDLSTCLN